MQRIDTSFDMRLDSKDRDPDGASPTLRNYHMALWSKALPSGKRFDLVDTKRRAYLYHSSDLGVFYLSSDSIIHTYHSWPSMQPVLCQLPDSEKKHFLHLAYTIGAFIVFPGDQVERQHTINQARGISKVIRD